MIPHPIHPVHSVVNSQRGIVMVTVLMLAIILAALGGIALTTTSTDRRASTFGRQSKKAFYLAEAGIERARAELFGISFNDALDGVDNLYGTTESDLDNGILPFGKRVQLCGGAFEVVVADNNDGDGDPCRDSDGRIFITSVCSLSVGSRRKVETVAAVDFNPENVTAALLCNGNVDCNGGITIDGRDHDLSGNPVGGGVLAVSSRSTVSISGNAGVSGISQGGMEYIWDKKAAATIIPEVTEENATWEEMLTPEDALGIGQEDYFKTVAQSGYNGSQYVTDPDSLSWPLSGVTYVELPAGGEWKMNSVDFTGSEGILIVHNDQRDALISNSNSHSQFKGIIIADDCKHHHNLELLGSLITLNPSPSANIIGNSGGSITYSSIAIWEAMSGVPGNPMIVSWKDEF